jgi:type I restriction enzyme, S subunit
VAVDAHLIQQPNPTALPTPEVEWGAMPASALSTGERRLEAEAYLSDGYGKRTSIEARPTGWTPLAQIASVWQPSRLKGVVVSRDRGTPFLAAGQVFEARPTPRKFLSLTQTENAATRFVDRGTVLMSCSGEVGKVTIAHSPHVARLITHDLLRIQPTDQSITGWLYAYLRTPAFRSIAAASHYGHVIKHIEPSHLMAMPVVEIPKPVALWFQERVEGIVESRDQAHQLEQTAHRYYGDALAPEYRPVDSDTAVVVRENQVTGGRRRLDAYYYNATVRQVESAIAARADHIDRLSAVCERIFAPSRFTREFGEAGTPYRSAEELFDLNAPVSKRIYAGLVANREEYMLQPGWLVMACSGQIYGLNGAVMMLNDSHSGVFATHDLIRLVPDAAMIRPGYLLTALGHPTLGRPLVIRHAYGTSIPHLEVGDIETIPIPRLTANLETLIADQMETVVRLRAAADSAETEVTERAASILQKFIQGVANYSE